jgi:6-phosphogluconolactonase
MAQPLLHFVSWLGVLAVLGASVLAASAAEQGGKAAKYWVYFGTYTGAKPGAASSKGIYRSVLDVATGKLTEPELVAETSDPSFLALDPSKRRLYCVAENGDDPAGEIKAYTLDAKTGNLTYLNSQSSEGGAPCHLTVDHTGKYVLAANYTGGSVICLPIESDGRLGKKTAFIQHKAENTGGKKGQVHAHSVNMDAANHFAVVADLGLDKVFVYKFDPSKGTLAENDAGSATLPKGAGPRHFAFHPNGKFGYSINELNFTITAMTYDADKGALKPFQTVPTVPGPAKGSTAEVVVHPSGKFLYGSNRGPDSIAIYSINEQTGELKSVGWQGKDIKEPRNFAIDPTGTFMLVGNQNSDSVVEFRIDPKTGELAPTDVRLKIFKPVCVRFVEIAK